MRHALLFIPAALLAAGCAGLSSLHVTNCSGNKCETTNISTTAPSPPSTVTVTSAPSLSPGCQGGPCVNPPGEPAPVSIGPCTVSLDYASMQALATSQAQRAAEAWCMQIPPANQAAFEQWLAEYALQALNSGEFSTYQDRKRWADSYLAGAYYQYR
jgi:hypothetical protein